MTRGKVVLVPFPFDDLATEKARPAVCLTEPLTSHRHIVLAFVTSRQPDELLDTDVVIDPGDQGFAQTVTFATTGPDGLDKKSSRYDVH